MSITRLQAQDLLEANYSAAWSWDDPEWWDDMVEMLMGYRSVKQLRREDRVMTWRVPPWWPGNDPEARAKRISAEPWRDKVTT